MSKVPSLPYTEIVRALERAGWRVIRQKGSHIRMEKTINDETLRLTVPAHRPVKRSTLSHILKQAGLSVEEFLELL
ncbi:MAG: type II toxin-antitoxin system HicA family toxin [Armatimonadota bacterium]